jgi:uncharacterized membrane protein YcaP (DUF421 family)
MNEIDVFFSGLFGLEVDPRNLTVRQMSARTLLVFACTLVMLRIAHKRFFAQRNALDVLLTLIVASTLSRSINGNAALFPTIAIGFLLILSHRLLTAVASRSHWVGQLLKGSPTPLIEEGKLNDRTLREHHLSHDDLAEDLRLKGVETPEAVRRATLERNGEISVIKR